MIMLCSGHYFGHYFVRDYKPTLIGVFAEFESGILSERVKAGLASGSCACCCL